MVSFPAVKIGKQWKNILKEILKYLSGEPQEQVRQKSQGGFKDASSCPRAVYGTRYHLPSCSFKFSLSRAVVVLKPGQGLIPFSLQSTYLTIRKKTDKEGPVLLRTKYV